ncbi:MAG TPA: N-acetyl-gamma-glutamyl-phosphate reductase [Chromatiales bacterium]|nr:N-acetyl-gamma-glutamyl-phosphate reductase [Thiotrichales bacterium]HIP68960.1 N-acetyl-gamma-glutamyl-phosphate reductase [Chromatiales bacterium]
MKQVSYASHVQELIVIKCGIVGATGYTGVELLRLLASHPDASIEVVTSRSESGRPVADLFTNLRGHVDLAFTEPDMSSLTQCDMVFFATPNGTAMKYVPELLEAGVRVIDLAADFRIKDQTVWEQWYGMPHACPALLAEAVYGLPEINRDAIRKAQLVANPGCYPTAVTLGFLPLLKAGLVDVSQLIADAKSGVSGAGRKAQVGSLLAEAGDNFKAYAVPGHRHLPEIRQTLSTTIGEEIGLTFVPHLLPILRGIHATLYAKIQNKTDLQSLYEQHYADEPFVDVLPAGSHPETRSCRGANLCRIAVHQPQDGDTVVVLSVIDNLVKGAAGQAVQNMNLMCGLDESAGLTAPALLP